MAAQASPRSARRHTPMTVRLGASLAMVGLLAFSLLALGILATTLMVVGLLAYGLSKSE